MVSEKPTAMNPVGRLINLEDELHNREREIELLKETAAAVGSELDMGTLLQLIAERARELIQAETLLIPILDDACQTYTYRAGSGRNAAEIIGEALPLDFGVCGWVWRKKRAWWRGALDELDAQERNRWEREAGTLILVPLVGKEHFLGGLAGINKITGDDFSHRDLNLLTLFASQVSVAIENAMAYAELALAKTTAEAYQNELRRLNTHLTATNKELEYLALYDQLTGLPNRSLIQDRLQQALRMAQRAQQSLAVMLIDLDLFKQVNDTLGHEAGDQLLKEVGRRFSSQLRHSDTVGRLGGDEFAVIAPSADTEAATSLARNLLAALEPEFEVNGTRFSVAASIGIAVYPTHGNDVSGLFRHADAAMYIAKRTRFGYSIYDASEEFSTPGRLALTGDLRQALANREFELYYQPKIDLNTGMLVGVEALSRWPHPHMGFVSPDEFIPIMEQTGLIRSHSLWAIERALHQVSCWQKNGLTLSVAVNLSMHSLLDPQFPGQLLALLNRFADASLNLILEITESVFLSEHVTVRDALLQLRKQGVQFSIDDFGTGYSSLSRLRKLPVSELKIDRSFVKDMLKNNDDAVIVRSTVDLAHNLGLFVIAEGVESEASLMLLREMGCDLAQGDFISRSLPADEFALFLENTHWILPGRYSETVRF